MWSKLSLLPPFLFPTDHAEPETSSNLFSGGFFPSGLRLFFPQPWADFPHHQSLDSKAAVLLDLPGTIITTVGGVAGRQSKWR